MAASKSTLQETTTTVAPDEVLERAKKFFAKPGSVYSAFLDKEGPGYCTFRGQGGEEIVIAAAAGANGTRVSGSTYLFDMQVGRFFATLPAVEATSPVARVTA
jgi:hypothetical protein